MTILTTHDPLGGGRPRFIFVRGDAAGSNFEQAEFNLLPGVTTIGSHPEADLVLAGLTDRHAEVRRNDSDEYVYFHTGSHPATFVDGKNTHERVLRTGNRIETGSWMLTFFREEFADHGRPHGGRQGGEGAVQHGQRQLRPRGTSLEGGSHPGARNAGEYF